MTAWAFAARIPVTPIVGTVGTAASIGTVVPPTGPTTLTISGSASGTNGVATTITGTLDAAATTAVTVTPTAATGATFSTPAVIGVGQTSTTWTVTRATSGTAAINASTSPSLTVTGGFTYTSGPSAWNFSDGATVARGRNTTTALRTGMAGTEWVTASPDLLPGERLSNSGGTLSIVADSTTPTVDGSSSGSLIDIISARDVVIEVIDTADQHATAQNMRTGTMYGRGAASPRDKIQRAIEEAIDGDTIQISPGAIWRPGLGDGSSSLENACLAVYRSLTITGIPGRGRWSLTAPGVIASTYSGIVVWEPSQAGSRLTVVVEDCDLDRWGTDAADRGIRIRPGPSTGSNYDNLSASFTLRRFKLGKAEGTSGSGIANGPETLVLEDGHIFDCGDGSGLEHNMYVSARTMTLRGLHIQRTRGWSGTPWGGGTATMEGHLAKLSAVNGTVEACVFNCTGMADASRLLQMKAGGNWTVRGNLFRDAAYPNAANGAIMMTREFASDGVTPNFEWWAGSEGNSLDFQRNVYIGHYPRPIIFFNDQSSAAALRPATGGSYTAAERLSSLTVQDNIAMVAGTAQGLGGQWMLSGFPGTNNSQWILNDPNAGTYWAARNNTVLAYGIGEPGFSDDSKRIMEFARQAGAIAATGGSMTLNRFVYPHGYTSRTDSARGLG